MAGHDFEVVYKKGAQNTQAETLSRLLTSREALSSKDDYIPCFTAESPEPGSVDPAEPERPIIREIEADVNNMLAIGEISTEKPVPGTFVPIQPEEFIREQFSDPFCTEVRARLNGGEIIPFGLIDSGYLVRTVESTPQTVVPRSLKKWVLHLSQCAEVVCHAGGR